MSNVISYPREVRAKKKHVCDFCGMSISEREKYMKSTYSHEGSLYDWKTHKHCSDIAEKLNMYNDFDDGLTGEDFREIIHDAYFELIIKPFPKEKEERGKFQEVIEHLRYVNFRTKLGYVIRQNKTEKP